MKGEMKRTENEEHCESCNGEGKERESKLGTVEIIDVKGNEKRKLGKM